MKHTAWDFFHRIPPLFLIFKLWEQSWEEGSEVLHQACAHVSGSVTLLPNITNKKDCFYYYQLLDKVHKLMIQKMPEQME